jgi:general secretion pathway protein B
MSYILDALRKADAERERDPARGIHAQPAMPAGAPTGRAVPGWAWGGAALGGAALAAFIAWPQQQEPVAAAAVPMEAPAPLPAPALVTVATAVSPPAPPPLPAPVAARPVSTAPEGEKKAVAAPSTAIAVPAAAAPAAPPSATPPDRILAFADLPPDVQRELPKLAISGGVHSENAAQRLLVVGGQVVNEGAELAPGVVLEQIRARNAVLRYRGYRYSVAY